MATVNSVTGNMGVQVSVLYAELHPLGYMPRNGIGGLYDGCIFSFFEKPPYRFL
jgi:hypothetical protein